MIIVHVLLKYAHGSFFVPSLGLEPGNSVFETNKQQQYFRHYLFSGLQSIIMYAHRGGELCTHVPPCALMGWYGRKRAHVPTWWRGSVEGAEQLSRLACPTPQKPCMNTAVTYISFISRT